MDAQTRGVAEAARELGADVARAARLMRADGERGSGAPVGGDDPGVRSAGLRRCAALFRLTAAELDVLSIALAVEIDPAFSALFARRHRDPNRRRPTVGDLRTVAGDGDPSVALETFTPTGHLVRSGLLELLGDGPHTDQAVRIPDTFWPRLAGLPGSVPYPVTVAMPDRLPRLVLADTTRAQIEHVLALARAERERPPLVWIAGRPGSGRESIAAALAGALGFSALVVDAAAVEDAAALPHLARESAWARALAIVYGAPSPGALARLAHELPVPIAVIAEGPAPIEPSPSRWCAAIDVAPLDVDRRAALWRDHLLEHPLAADVDVPALAARVRAGPGRVAAAATIARRAAAAQRRPTAMADLLTACRTSRAAALAQWSDVRVTLDELIVPPATRRELDLAITWARRGPSVFHPAGAGRRLRGLHGLVCLFHGPPGTGKTMAAHALASAIGAAVLRVDLSQVVNKYIGETEKNLDRVFDDAEECGAVLLFDEADALFSRRTDVKDANDRYGNMESAFLLQRLERHPGVCVLASNLRQNLDDAFSRRIHIIAEFPAPGRDERRRIWALQLPPEELAGDVDLAALADRAALSGGDIRNAAATAALLAAEESSPVAMRHLVVGIWRELRKSGRLVSPDDFGPWKHAILAAGGAGRSG